MLGDAALRVGMEANLDRDWPPVNSALIVCPHCACVIEDSIKGKENHKSWHRAIGY